MGRSSFGRNRKNERVCGAMFFEPLGIGYPGSERLGEAVVDQRSAFEGVSQPLGVEPFAPCCEMRIGELKSSDRRQAIQLKDGSNFHSSLLGSGYASCDIDRVVEVCRVDKEVTAELFARFGERAVRHLALSLTDTNAGRSRNWVQGGSARNFPCL